MPNQKKKLKSDSKTDNNKSSKMGLKPGWTRATFIIRDEHIAKLKSIAYWERISIKDILEQILDLYLQGKNFVAVEVNQKKKLKMKLEDLIVNEEDKK